MKRTTARLSICIIYIIAVLAFIWGNSMLPGKESGELSGFVGSILKKLLPFLRLDLAQGMNLLRKGAHFSEFAALGFGLAWLFGMLIEKRLPNLLLPLACGVLAASVDETLQIFTPDRGPSVKDVGIDTAGVITGILFLTFLHMLVTKLRKRT